MTSATGKLVILISGRGSNLQSFINSTKSGTLAADIAAVFSNRPTAYGLERAANAGIPTEVIDHTQYHNRNDFDTELIKRIDDYSPNLIILAGFMRILTAKFVDHFHGRLLNIHPSLLPKYPGLQTHQRAIEAGDNKAGATVHFVTPALDNGPNIIQASLAIKPNDNADNLAERILELEHQIYPLAAQWFIEGRLRLEKNNAQLDNKNLPSSGYQFNQQP